QFSDATDLLLEKTVGRGAARPIWNEMKGNTALAFEARRGGQVLLDALDALRRNWGERFELHVIGHSAGSIFLGHLLSALTARKPPRDSAPAKLGALWPKTVNLFAPACTVAFANQHYAGNEDVLDRLSMDILSDRAERDDNVSYIYRKSLLYFVSAALEADPRTPLLGMARIGSPEDHGWDGSSDTGETLAAWRLAAQQADLSRRTEVVDKPVNVATGGGGRTVQPASHGGFDNDIDVVSRTLARITGGDLALPVVDLRGY
ncbi:MAG: peptidase C1, partial [Burkholderiaceae bacterium]